MARASSALADIPKHGRAAGREREVEAGLGPPADVADEEALVGAETLGVEGDLVRAPAG
jgi:hypothetical protein